MPAPVSLNAGRHKSLEGTLIWRSKCLHLFFPGSPLKGHNFNFQEKRVPQGWKEKIKEWKGQFDQWVAPGWGPRGGGERGR